ncbi:hypothetical protein CDAR_61851 [Caerostris darwini]|uniref:Uncharacterized protein n=1 Tax=Caerostris darwini TaxID=1538125 RepID=A0AAV4VIW6_9ARAC|nr:hypothetical protein CDAR_61851 [Caerostris darwini]
MQFSFSQAAAPPEIYFYDYFSFSHSASQFNAYFALTVAKSERSFHQSVAICGRGREKILVAGRCAGMHVSITSGEGETLFIPQFLLRRSVKNYTEISFRSVRCSGPFRWECLEFNDFGPFWLLCN